MKIEEILETYNTNRLEKSQALYTSIFVIQNRLQNAGEKIQNELSIKQWLLLTMVSVCPESRTLSNIGRLMGCSRQNVKKLVSTLEKKQYIRLIKGSNNSLCIELTDKVEEYGKKIGKTQLAFLELLFKEFSDREIEQFFKMVLKLYSGLEKVEDFSGGANYE